MVRLKVQEDNVKLKMNAPDGATFRTNEYTPIMSGSSDYNELDNKPSINGHTLEGDQTSEDLGLFSGDYNDLINKPNLFSGDYDDLTDKPSINGNTLEGDKTAEELGIISQADLIDFGHTLAPVITDTAQGYIVSVTDGADNYPIKSLKVSLQPKQSGTGDPSPQNVRPISGYDEVKVEHTWGGLLLPSALDSKTSNGVTFDSDGNGMYHIHGTPSKINAFAFFDIPEFEFPSTNDYKIYIGNRTADTQLRLYFYNGTTQLDYWMASPIEREIALPQGTLSGNKCNRLRFIVYGTDPLDIYLAPQVRKIANIESHTITLPSTVYGGEVDVVKGLLKSYPFYPSYNGETLSGEWICDRAVYSQGTTPPIGSQVVDMSGNGTEYQLEPTEIKTLKGDNTLWSDGEVECEYCCDTKLYIEKKLNE